MLTSSLRYWNTIRYLKPIQIYGRVIFALRRPKLPALPATTVKLPSKKWTLHCQPRATLLERATFVFHHQQGELEEIGWNGPQRSKLWRYNQHYFDDLTAKDYEARLDWHLALVKNWITHNPTGNGIGWHPYPLSLRIANWVIWHLQTGSLDRTGIQSLATQCHWLNQRIEWHILGNHLVSNAKALIFGGLLFADDDVDWLNQGLKILKTQLDEQVLADGGHYERSPMYHHIVLKDLLDVIQILSIYNTEIPTYLTAAANKMLSWAISHQHPDGEIPFFNDSAYGIASTIDELVDYYDHLNETQHSANRLEPTVSVAQTGIAILRNSKATLFADVGTPGPSFLPAHAHAGSLSFELSVGTERVVVNGGVSTYEGCRRTLERSTANHSTLELDFENSSDVWGSFRMAKRAQVDCITKQQDGDVLSLSARHSGYVTRKRLVYHTRHWLLNSERISITDELSGNAKHNVNIYFIIPPTLTLETLECSSASFSSTCSGTRTIFTWPADLAGKVDSFEWAPEFGKIVEAKRLTISAYTQLPFSCETTIRWEQV